MDYGSSKTTNVLLGLTFLVGIAGIGMGYAAYNEYSKMNELTTIQTLDANELKIWDLILNDDDLNALWTVFPDNMSVRERAHRQLLLLSGNPKNRMKPLSLKGKWSNVLELDDVLYCESDFYNNSKVKLRKGYSVMDRVIYLLFTAYHAKSKNMIKDDIWETYEGYIYDFGAHPLFLAALSFWHDSGYFNKDFARMIQAKYMSKPKLMDTITEIYPEMKNKEWVDRVGKNRN